MSEFMSMTGHADVEADKRAADTAIMTPAERHLLKKKDEEVRLFFRDLLPTSFDHVDSSRQRRRANGKTMLRDGIKVTSAFPLIHSLHTLPSHSQQSTLHHYVCIVSRCLVPPLWEGWLRIIRCHVLGGAFWQARQVTLRGRAVHHQNDKPEETTHGPDWQGPHWCEFLDGCLPAPACSISMHSGWTCAARVFVGKQKFHFKGHAAPPFSAVGNVEGATSARVLSTNLPSCPLISLLLILLHPFRRRPVNVHSLHNNTLFVTPISVKHDASEGASVFFGR